MYLEHYALTDFPFQLTPDQTFFFDSRPHRKGMAYLTYGLSKGEGFIIITGEIGAGKTTLLNHLLSTINDGRTVVASVVNTRMHPDDLLRAIAAAFGVGGDSNDKITLLRAVEAFLVKARNASKRALLIVDEAQNLTAPALEELRLLSNLQMENRSLLQVCLSGQPEFRKALANPGLEQLRQRVVASYHLWPMDAEDTRSYIEHRLQWVGWSGIPAFDAGAFTMIFEKTKGVPRKINLLCDRLLLFGYLDDKHRFSATDVQNVVSEIEGEPVGLASPASDAADEGREAPAQPARKTAASGRELDLLAHHLAFMEQLLASTLSGQREDRQESAPTGEAARVEDLKQHVAQLRKRLG